MGVVIAAVALIAVVFAPSGLARTTEFPPAGFVSSADAVCLLADARIHKLGKLTLNPRGHLGGSTLFVGHQTGYEVGESLTYGFDANKRLVSLETSVGGC